MYETTYLAACLFDRLFVLFCFFPIPNHKPDLDMKQLNLTVFSPPYPNPNQTRKKSIKFLPYHDTGIITGGHS